MSAFTPGPWILQPDLQIAAGNFRIWLTIGHSPGERQEIWDANARLIAAAPELLEALKDTLAELSPLMQAYRPEHYDTICGKARAAIEKAELPPAPVWDGGDRRSGNGVEHAARDERRGPEGTR